MKRILLVFVFLANFAGADVLNHNLNILNDLSYNISEMKKFISSSADLEFININSALSAQVHDKQIYELLDMLKLVVKTLGVLSFILTAFLVYFIYENVKFRNKTLKELEKAKKELENSAIKDNLTGLSNKRYFQEVFDIEYSISTREKTHLNFFLLEVNDINGLSQSELESLLSKISNLLKLYFKRATDSIFRLEKGIFAGIILSKEEPEVKLHLEKLLIELKESNEELTVSIGLKTNHIDEKLSKDSIYNMALHSLAVAKEKGADKIVEFDETLKK